jgi:hypothetical protein
MKTEKEMREYAKASAAYWLDCSEHEQTPEDAKILACYARLAIDRIVELEAAPGNAIEKAAREGLANILEAAKGFERGFYLFGLVTSGQLQDAITAVLDGGEP